MTANQSPIFGLYPKTQGTQWVNADGTAQKPIYTAGYDGARLISVAAVTSDTSPNDVGLFIQPGGSGPIYPIGAKRVPAGAGNLVAIPDPACSLLDTAQFPQLEADGSYTLWALDVVYAQPVAAVTAGKTLTITVNGIDY